MTTFTLDPHRVTDYFAQRYEVCVERTKDGFFLSDGFVIVQVPLDAPVLPYTCFNENWRRATWSGDGSSVFEKTFPDQSNFWSQCQAAQVHPLTLTPQIEVISGLSWRTFSQEDGRPVYLQRRITDIVESEWQALVTFTFDVCCAEKAPRWPVRISKGDQVLAIAMPGRTFTQELEDRGQAR